MTCVDGERIRAWDEIYKGEEGIEVINGRRRERDGK